jgi:hypothetical protein
MIFNMHCRLSSSTNEFPCSSFILPQRSIHSDRITTVRHRRRRLEDPILTYASNYYVTNPRQTSHSPSLTPIRTKDKNIYCDLFNLLERPSSSQPKNGKSRQSKGFFRRVVRNYFCMPMTIAN